MVVLFAGNPHLVDEIAQLFHARAFAAGRLAAPVPQPAEAFLMLNTGIVNGAWTSIYPPGHTVLLALGLLSGAEWLVNPLLGGIGTVLIYAVARGLYGPRTGMVAAFLWAASAWVMFLSASYVSHVSATVLALAAWAAVFRPKRPAAWHFVLAGLALAAAASVRPLDGAAAAVPLLVWAMLRKRWRGLGWMALGGSPVMLLMAYFNWRLFGSPTTFGYTAFFAEELRLGFHADPWGYSYTPLVALSNLTVAIRRLHVYLYEWPIPALLPLAIWAIAAKSHRKNDLILAVGAIAIPLLYFFYWHSGFFRGPRFYFAATPFLIIGTARAWRWGASLARRKTSAYINLRVALVATALTTLVWGLASLLPQRMAAYRDQLTAMKRHPERELAALGVRQAVVIVPGSWVSRTVAGFWSLGVPHGVVERAFRLLDSCDLHQLLVEARRTALSGDATTSRLQAMLQRARTVPLVLQEISESGAKLRPRERLPEECVEELQREAEGFTLYGNLGWRNSVGLSSGIVFARDLFERNDELFNRYPDWEVWRWAPPPGQPKAPPVLQPISRGRAGAPEGPP
jgi:hypothetical protein